MDLCIHRLSSSAGLSVSGIRGGRLLRRRALLLLTPPSARRRFAAPASSRPGSDAGGSFDLVAFEAERNRLDSEARESMARVAESSMAVAEEEEEGSDGDPKAWKWKIRKRIWDLMEAEGIAQNPRPVRHRIPNFVGAAAAADAVVFYTVVLAFSDDVSLLFLRKYCSIRAVYVTSSSSITRCLVIVY